MLGILLKDEDLVFRDFEGKPLLPDTITHAWIKLVRYTGLKGIRFYDALWVIPRSRERFQNTKRRASCLGRLFNRLIL